MYKFNEEFKQVLRENQFQLKYQDKTNEWIYSGKISVNRHHVIDFAVSIAKDETHSIYQVVYHNLAICKSFAERDKWLEFINNWNKDKGVFYYLCLGDDGRVFMRYVGSTDCSAKQVHNLLVKGSSLAHNVLAEITKTFGEVIIF